jgi:hypothetical protein
MILQYTTYTQPYTPRAFAIVEPKGNSLIARSSNNDIQDTPQHSAMMELKLPNRDTKVEHMQTLISDRFLVTVIKYATCRISTIEIRNRGTLELRHFQQIPYKSWLDSISGKWALLYAHIPLPDDVIRRQVVVWDLESGRQCPGHIDTREINMWCIHRVDGKHATVYTATANPDKAGVFEWALYQFSLDGPAKQLRRGRLQSNVEADIEWEVYSLDFQRVVYVPTGNVGVNQRIIHTTPCDEDSRQATTPYKVPKGHIVVPLLELYQMAKEDRKIHGTGGIDYKTIHWPNATRWEHIIGNICIAVEAHDDKERYALVDISTGRLVRYIDTTVISEISTTLMTSIVGIDNDHNEIQVIDYGAL